MHSLIQRGATSLMVLLLIGSMGLAGCASLSNTEKGAAVGAGTGAVVGGAIGKATGSTAKGAIIGAVLGGAAGAIIGQQMDKQAAELEEELEDVDIERVGEGIQVTFDSGILFDFDSAALRPEARENLRRLAESLQEYENTDLVIIGHTDARGSDAYNQHLSVRRAASASGFLKSLHVAPSRITTLGKGETEPVASNDTDAGRQENRRVEVAIFASEEYRQELSDRH
ncbi:MAG: OmpA family protein [Rhodothermales bacterium]